MPTVKGKAGVKSFFAAAPQALETKILRGAARLGGRMIAESARDRVTSDLVRDAIVVRVKATDGRIVVKISVKFGWALTVGTWLEYGTDAHFISVDDSQRQGMSVRRVNEQQRAGSLAIGGEFVGKTVWHPGARPHPFLRPALDDNEREAVAAMQGYITTRLQRYGLGGPAEPEDTDR